jgi:hypothetical protein
MGFAAGAAISDMGPAIEAEEIERIVQLVIADLQSKQVQ